MTSNVWWRIKRNRKKFSRGVADRKAKVIAKEGMG